MWGAFSFMEEGVIETSSLVFIRVTRYLNLHNEIGSQVYLPKILALVSETYAF